MSFRPAHVVTAMIAAGMLTSVASAHAIGDRLGDFYAGFLHPITALEHLLPLLALGLLAGQQSPRTARGIVMAVPLAIMIGALCAAAFDAERAVVAINRISFVAIGVLVAGAWRLPPATLVPGTIALGLTHGYENGLAMSDLTVRHLFVMGLGVAGLFLLILPAGLVVGLRRPWETIAVRVAGSWIAAIGLMAAAV